MTTSVYMGLSFTKPSPNGQNISEPEWTSYVRQLINPSVWTPQSGSEFLNNVTIGFAQINIPANTYYNISYFTIYDLTNQYIGAGSINPNAYLGPNATLSFLPGNFLFQYFDTDFIPITSNNAFPTITYPTFTPTYEPYSLGEPIAYGLNMRS
jgi:hypothetical protein